MFRSWRIGVSTLTPTLFKDSFDDILFNAFRVTEREKKEKEEEFCQLSLNFKG